MNFMSSSAVLFVTERRQVPGGAPDYRNKSTTHSKIPGDEVERLPDNCPHAADQSGTYERSELRTRVAQPAANVRGSISMNNIDSVPPSNLVEEEGKWSLLFAIEDGDWGKKSVHYRPILRYDGLRACSIAIAGSILVTAAWAVGSRDQALIFMLFIWAEFYLAFGQLAFQRFVRGIMVSELFNKGFYLECQPNHILARFPQAGVVLVPLLYAIALYKFSLRYRINANLGRWRHVLQPFVLPLVCMTFISVPYAYLEIYSFGNALLLTLGIAELAIGDALSDITDTAVGLVLGAFVTLLVAMLLLLPSWQTWAMWLMKASEDQDQNEVRDDWKRMKKMIAEQMGGIPLSGEEMSAIFVSALRGRSGESAGGSKMLLRLHRVGDTAHVSCCFVGPSCGLDDKYGLHASLATSAERGHGYPLEITSIRGVQDGAPVPAPENVQL